MSYIYLEIASHAVKLASQLASQLILLILDYCADVFVLIIVFLFFMSLLCWYVVIVLYVGTPLKMR